MGYEDVNTGGVCFGLALGMIQENLYNEKNWVEVHKIFASVKTHQIKKLLKISKSNAINLEWRR